MYILRDGDAYRDTLAHVKTFAKREDDTTGFRTPFLTFVIIAIAVILALLLVFTRVLFLQRRSVRDMPRNDFAPVIYNNVPKQDFPPPIHERKVSLLSNGSETALWKNMQPISVAFDRDITAHLRARADSGADMNTNPPNGYVQTSFLLCLPTPSMTFPEHLRRRVIDVPKRSADSRALKQGTPSSVNKDTTYEATDASKLRRAPSIRSVASHKEQGEARREAFFKEMETSATGNPDLDRSETVRSNLSEAHRAILNRHETGTDDCEAEAIGSFALGSMVMRVQQSISNKDDSQVPLTNEQVVKIFEHAKQAREAFVSRV